jgi:hypothetical protein
MLFSENYMYLCKPLITLPFICTFICNGSTRKIIMSGKGSYARPCSTVHDRAVPVLRSKGLGFHVWEIKQQKASLCFIFY